MASNINPNDIDGAYPVAGQDNNSQGFRDNFTNTKTNFQAAAIEITDLQSKSVLKGALTGTTLDNNMNNGTIYAVNLNDVSSTRIAVTATAGVVTINYASGQYQTVSTTDSITFGFINFPASGFYGTVRLAINITNIAHTVTLPAAVTQGIGVIQGYNSGTITFAATGIYVFEFSTSDGATTITIEDLSRPLANATVTATTISASGNVIAGNVITAGTVALLTGTAVPVGGTAGAGIRLSSTANLGVFFGSGAPSLTAAQGSLYLRTDGSTTATRLYVNTNGTTAWTSVTTAS